MGSSVRIVAVALAAVLLGLAAGWGVFGESSEAPERVASPAAGTAAEKRPGELELAGPRTEEAAPQTAAKAARAPASGEQELFHAGLEEFGREGIRRGWSEFRSDAIPDETMQEGLADYRQAVLEAPELIGSALARREDERDAARADAAAGGAFALLERLNEGGAGPMPELARDAEAFEKLFARTAPEVAVNGLHHTAKPDEVIEDGVTLRFPAGVFRLTRLMQDKDVFPRDVTIRGAGMNATLILLSDLSTRHRLQNFSVQDCTLYSVDDGVFDLRREPAIVRFDRVRVCGFDAGHAGSKMLKSPGAAFFARGCLILGGYGRAPGHGDLLDVRANGLLARFEDCRIEGVRPGLGGIRPGATVAFVNCALVDIPSGAVLPDDLERPGIVLEDTSVTWRDVQQNPLPEKDLNDLFPDWRERINK